MTFCNTVLATNNFLMSAESTTKCVLLTKKCQVLNFHDAILSFMKMASTLQ